MDSQLPFTNNFRDLSTDKGFQFKFSCGRCGNGYLSAFQHNILGVAGGALQVASGLFGGLRRAASSAQQVQRLVGGPAHDAAMRVAVEEVAPQFNQCNRCGKWVCRKVCWNGERNQCVSCSPKMDQELAALESEGTVRQLRDKIRYGGVDLSSGVTLNSSATGQQSTAAPRPCACGAEISQGAKFCHNCGDDVALKQNCPQCSVESTAGANFCADCGHRFGP